MIDADANAAAATLVRARHPAAVALLAGPDRYLVAAATPTGAPATLIARTVEFLWPYRDVCDDPKHLPAGRTFADILDSHVPDGAAGARWRRFNKTT